ncbi:hypothetical protein acdb102_02030 [Acidothermaceae bacterium B102]|nr:hypothetical protein acdb102_02030 [Acidothermaceae bacterium B102]
MTTTATTTTPAVKTTTTTPKPQVKTTTPSTTPSKTPEVLPTSASTPSVKGTTLTKTPEGSSLPFTGGEFVLMSTAGLAALGAGAALVVVSRRRRSA